MRTEKDEIIRAEGVSFREGLGPAFPEGHTHAALLHSPKTPWGFGHPVPVSLALCAPIVSASRSGVAPEALWIKPRLEIIPPPV